MHSIRKNGLKLFLVAGLLLMFYFWSLWTCPAVDIRPRRGSSIQKLLTGKTGDILIAYPDIAYRIKENVAWCVIHHNVWLNSNLISVVLLLTHSVQLLMQSFSTKCMCLLAWWRNRSCAIVKPTLPTGVSPQPWACVLATATTSWQDKRS